jgi:hypothetical protein
MELNIVVEQWKRHYSHVVATVNFTARQSAEFQAAANTSWCQPRLKNAYRIRIDN